jgi:hypothetical protein
MLIEKQILKTVLLAISAFAPMARGGLVVHYQFDGNLLDVSGNGFPAGDGQLVGDTHYVAGKSGQSLDFDGAGDYIRAMAAPNGFGGWTPQFVMNSPAVTISMWIKMDAFPTSTVNLIASRSWVSGDNLIELSVFGFDTPFYVVQQGIWMTEFPRQKIPAVKLGNWIHLAVTYDTIAQKSYMYIDGVAGAVASITSGAKVNIGNYIIGGNAYLKARYFDGQIDEVRIYDYALSPYEIQVLYHEFDEFVDQCGSTGYLPWDLNYDCRVDLKDIAVFAGDWTTCTMPEDSMCQAP